MSRRLERHVRIQFARILRKPGQKRGFRVAQISHWFVEIIIRRGSEPDVQISEIEPIQISGEDLVLRPYLFETKSSQRFRSVLIVTCAAGARKFSRTAGVIVDAPEVIRRAPGP